MRHVAPSQASRAKTERPRLLRLRSTVAVAVGLVLLGPAPLEGQAGTAPEPTEKELAELRGTIGEWEVVTTFFGSDGTASRTVTGGYRFEWVIKDRVASGSSWIPELGQRSALLFYVSPERRAIEMTSVGADGKLWIMTGPLGDSVRTTAPYQDPARQQRQLRFTRFNVTPDRFESRMDHTGDNGRTWLRGNHQVFTRRPADPR